MTDHHANFADIDVVDINVLNEVLNLDDDEPLDVATLMITSFFELADEIIDELDAQVSQESEHFLLPLEAERLQGCASALGFTRIVLLSSELRHDCWHMLASSSSSRPPNPPTRVRPLLDSLRHEILEARRWYLSFLTERGLSQIRADLLHVRAQLLEAPA